MWRATFLTYSSRYNFFVKWRAENFAYGLLFVTKYFSYGLWFSGNNSISGATSLNSLRKECLRGRGVPPKTTTLHNSYFVKVATLGGEGVKILKKWLRGLCMAPYQKWALLENVLTEHFSVAMSEIKMIILY